MQKTILRILILICLPGIILPASAQDQARSFQAIEFFSGSANSELHDKDNYRLVPLILDFDFDLRSPATRIGFNPASLAQFQIEPFLNCAIQPQTNLEGGLAFCLKFGFLPDDFRFQPYLKIGWGMIYLGQHTLEQGTQFNFISFLGSGLHYFFNKNNALTFEYRFRHLSNASIKQPNRGVETQFLLLGIAHHF